MKYNNLLVYIRGIADEEWAEVAQVNNYQYPFDNFIQEIEERREDSEEQEIEAFCVLAKEEDIQEIKENVIRKIRGMFDKLSKGEIEQTIQELKSNIEDKSKNILQRFFSLYISSILEGANLKYPRMTEIENSSGIICLVLYLTNSPKEEKKEKINQILRIFLERERPFYVGKQMMIQSFLLQDIKDRKILATLPDINGDWYALLEGGVKLYLDNQHPYQREKISSRDIGVWTNLELDSMVHNPYYSYRKQFIPYELFEEWNSVFMYALAVLPIQYEIQKIKPIYEEFLSWIEENVCATREIEENIISEETSIKSLLKNIEDIRRYIEGNDEVGISKNILILLRSRYAYLSDMYAIISKYYKEEVSQKSTYTLFSNLKWKELLGKIDKGNNYDKGLQLEEIANYFIECIEGLKVTKRRAKTENEEMDLVCCNVSENEELWRLGPAILIECKNWMNKVDTKVIRNLSYLMDKKGICTLLLFTKKNVTEGAEKEILKQAAHNRFILTFSLEDLIEVDNERVKPIELLILKFHELQTNIGNAMENMM